LYKPGELKVRMRMRMRMRMKMRMHMRMQATGSVYRNRKEQKVGTGGKRAGEERDAVRGAK